MIGEAADGTVTTWYRDELAPDQVVEARFVRDGTAMWLLLDRRQGGRQFVLGRVDAGGVVSEVLSAGLPSGDPGTYWAITDVAPDESLVAVAGLGPLVLVEPLTGRTRVVEGSLLGLLPATEVEAWAGDPFVAVSSGASLAPRLPAWAPLRPIDELIAEQVPPGRVLWQEEQAASDGPANGRHTVTSEPIELAGDLGVLLACSGPSDVMVRMEPSLPSGKRLDGLVPLVSRCRNGDRELAGGSSDGRDLDQTVRFVVESAADTSWQVVVFDPAPR